MTGRRATGGAAPGGAVPPSVDPLLTLFDVRYRHDYYNLADGRCPDLTAAPSGDCARFMARLGLLFRPEGDGFRIVLPQSRLAALMNAIDRLGPWTRLSFIMRARNPDFLGFTALPINMQPGSGCLYLGNLAASRRRGRLCLGKGAGVGAEALRPLANGAMTLVSSSAGTVTARAMSGEAVAEAALAPGVPATLDLSGQPDGLYDIAGVPGGCYDGPASVVLAPARPVTLGLIDLLLTRPDAGQANAGQANAGQAIAGQANAGQASAVNAAAFPIVLPAAGKAPPPPRTVALTIQFAARRTFWTYYVVPQQAHGRLADSLAIAGKGTGFVKSTEPLPNGDMATLFAATRPLPLRQSAPYAFSLSGHRIGSNGARNAIAIDRLPGAPGAPVWPGPAADALAGRSEIFVYV